MKPQHRFIAILLSYAIIILGTTYLSGYASEKTLYDRFIVSLEGIDIPVSNIKRSLVFYTKVLDFTPLEFKIPSNSQSEVSQIIGVQLPEKRKIFFSDKNSPSNNSLINPEASELDRERQIIIRVRNGFYKLHAALKNKAAYANQDSSIENSKTFPIREITTKAWGEEFEVWDPDGNKIIFYQPKRRSGSRYLALSTNQEVP